MKSIIRLSVLTVAVVVAGCGSSSAARSQPPATPTPSTPAPSASPDLSDYALDGGGLTYSSVLTDAGYTQRYPDTALDHVAGAFYIIEHGLPQAIDLNQVETGGPGSAAEGTAIVWEPDGRRDTLLPPGDHGERIYQVDVDLDAYVQGGDAIAHVSFISRAAGDALDPRDLWATPDPYPNQVYAFRLDKATAAALLDYFWMPKGPPGSAETESPEETAQD
jgi:hypothetical protein